MSAELVASHVDARIARVAARQHGVVSRAQLRALGLADSTIGARVAAGRLRIHRTTGLRDEEVTARYGIPVTTPARTILDLAAVVNEDRLERLLDQAEIEAVTDYTALGAALGEAA